ncbi:MAG: IS200/IS605 family accessory protein TnpB-related protein [Candidatus Nitrosotenuis sp.]
MHVKSAFKRNDRRVKGRFYQKIKGRQTRRVNQYLHKISKHIVQEAKKTKSMIVFEELKGIRKLYKKGNGQGNNYRRKLMVVLRTPKADRIQGKMGRHTCQICKSKTHKQALSSMRRVTPRGQAESQKNIMH